MTGSSPSDSPPPMEDGLYTSRSDNDLEDDSVSVQINGKIRSKCESNTSEVRKHTNNNKKTKTYLLLTMKSKNDLEDSCVSVQINGKVRSKLYH